MTAASLTAELTSQFAEVPPTLIACTVQAAAVVVGEDAGAADVARSDVAALAEAMRRSGWAAS